MQGDTQLVDGFLYETVDEQRCKCLTCQKVIYKLLQRAHSNSHSSAKVIETPRPVVKAVKKYSLQPEVTFNEGFSKSIVIELPKKNLENNDTPPPCKKYNGSNNFLECLKTSQRIKGSLQKMMRVFDRGQFLTNLKYFRQLKKKAI
jgi:hypothetical protein